MTFSNSWAFILLLPWLAVIALVVLQIVGKPSSLQYSSTTNLKKLPKTWRVKLRQVPTIMLGIAGVLLIFALARPQSSDTLIKKNVEGIDIVVALDISDSMLIEDMKPTNRLESAKETIANFVQKRTSDRIGLIIFAGESFTLVPLTLDYDLILSRTSEITTAQKARIKDGTAIGVALANASGRLKDSTAKSRVIIFLTDGENNSGTIDPETALTIAKGYGLKIYSIGIGKDGPTRIPVYARDVFGNQVKSYQPFESRVNEDLLSRMASETGGKYYRAQREDALAGIFNDIDRLEKTKVDVNKFTRYEERFLPYVIWGLILMGLAWALEIVVFRRVPA